VKTDRLNAFTDGVIAIIITIMVLELPVPKGAGMAALKPELTLFAAYALAFIKVGIYWFQHHHLLQASKRVDGRVLLTNLFFLFWLSLVPFVVRWVGEAGVTRDTVVAFGVVMLLCASSVALLRSALLAANVLIAPAASALARSTSFLGAISSSSIPSHCFTSACSMSSGRSPRSPHGTTCAPSSGYRRTRVTAL